MGREFFSKGSSNLLSRIAPESEKNSDDNRSDLEELGELMRQAFFPQAQPRSLRKYQY